MSAKKNIFPCGHIGKGSFCHRCAEADRLKTEARQEKAQKVQRLAQAPIPLEALPPKVAEKALEIIVALQQGKPYLDFMGKRLVKMGQREIISVPIGRNFRLICREENKTLVFVEAISHEEYSSKLSSGGWV